MSTSSTFLQTGGGQKQQHAQQTKQTQRDVILKWDQQMKRTLQSHQVLSTARVDISSDFVKTDDCKVKWVRRSLGFRFRGLFLYTAVVIFHI